MYWDGTQLLLLGVYPVPRHKGSQWHVLQYVCCICESSLILVIILQQPLLVYMCKKCTGNKGRFNYAYIYFIFTLFLFYLFFFNWELEWRELLKKNFRASVAEFLWCCTSSIIGQRQNNVILAELDTYILSCNSFFVVDKGSCCLCTETFPLEESQASFFESLAEYFWGFRLFSSLRYWHYKWGSSFPF